MTTPPVPTHTQLNQKFLALGCDTSKPGFYNDPPFIDAERESSELLTEYAYFALSHPSQSTVDESIVLDSASFVFDRLKKDGRLGACIDASSLLSEFLNRQGVWNFITKGGASVAPPHRPRPIRIPPICAPDNPASTGHAWVVAPPFHVIDIAIFLQPYEPDVQAKLPSHFIAKKPHQMTRVEPRFEELVELEIEEKILRAGGLRRVLGEETWDRIPRFGSWRVELDNNVEVRYAATGASAMDASLEEWQGWTLSGDTPLAVWEEFCRQK